MTTYAGDSSSFNSAIYLLAPTDPVLGGLTGVSNKPIKELADNTAYLQKYKGRIIRGSGTPSGNYNLTIDSDTASNTLYMDEVTGSFWKPTVVGSNITVWTNTYKSAKLNVKGIQINNNGTDTDYIQLAYDAVTNTVELRDEFGNLADVKVGKVYFNSLQAESGTQPVEVYDNEILLLSQITSEAANDHAFFSVKRLIDLGVTVTAFDTSDNVSDTWTAAGIGAALSLNPDPNDTFIQIRSISEETGEVINGYYQVGSISTNSFTTLKSFNPIISNDTTRSGLSGSISNDNSAIIRWNDTSNYFELVYRNGNLLPINCSSFFINGVPLTFSADRVITSQSQFNDLFAHLTSTGSTVCYLKTPEDSYLTDLTDEYIYLKKPVAGYYELSNMVEVIGSNVKIECAPGVFIKYMNEFAGFRTRNNTDMDVVSYNTGSKYFNIVSSDVQYSSGEDNGIDIVFGSNIVCYSTNEPTMNKKFTIDKIEKINTLDAGTHVNPAVNNPIFSAGSINNDVYHVYLSSNNLKVDKSILNLGTEEYGAFSTVITSSSSSSGVTGLDAAFDTNIYVANDNGTNLHYSITTTSASVVEFAGVDGTNSNGYKYPRIDHGASKMFIIAKNGNMLKIFASNTDTVGATWVNATIESSTNLAFEKYDVTYYNNQVFVTFINSAGYLKVVVLDPSNITGAALGTYTSPSIQPTKLSTQQGDANNPLRIVYADGSGVSYTTLNNTYTSTATLTLISSSVCGSNAPTFKAVPGNTFRPNSIVFTYGISGGNNILVGIYDGYYWGETTITPTAYAQNPIVVNSTNNNFYIFNQSTSSKLAKYEYNVKITVDETIPVSSVTDLVLSPNYVENTELILNIDGNESAITEPPHYFNLGNTYCCDFDLKLQNCVSASTGNSCIDFEDKTFGNTLKLKALTGDNNALVVAIYQLNHSTITNSRIDSTSTTFCDCTNINVIGIVNGISTIGNGYFNE